ncbi:MAG: hypothetical protein R3E08_08950 [Thiotrichaceae bacterium]
MTFHVRWLLFLYCLSLFARPVLAEPNTDTKKRIGYLEAGLLSTFTETMRATRNALQQHGWVAKLELPKDACFSPGWEPDKKKLVPEKAKELMSRNDLDLIIGGGTSAVRSLLEYNNHRVAIVGVAVSDPVKSVYMLDNKESTFVASEQDSGIDNFTIRIVPNQYRKMFEIFYDEVGFKKLGLLYVDEKNKNNVSSVDDAYEVSKSGRHFEIIEQRIENPKTDDCYKGIETLIKGGMDAFFIPSLSCFDWDELDPEKANPALLLKLLRDKKIRTFSKQGSRDVQGGAMMALSTVNYTDRGEFTAESIIEILGNHKKPRDLPMKDDAPPKITLNLEAAQEVGFSFSFDVLGASDELYEKITTPEKNPLISVCDLL